MTGLARSRSDARETDKSVAFIAREGITLWPPVRQPRLFSISPRWVFLEARCVVCLYPALARRRSRRRRPTRTRSIDNVFSRKLRVSSLVCVLRGTRGGVCRRVSARVVDDEAKNTTTARSATHEATAVARGLAPTPKGRHQAQDDLRTGRARKLQLGQTLIRHSHSEQARFAPHRPRQGERPRRGGGGGRTLQQQPACLTTSREHLMSTSRVRKDDFRSKAGCVQLSKRSSSPGGVRISHWQSHRLLPTV